ncbi:hypothetical protein TRFO_35950 [Tritrichomonas foetus]|uniref:Rap-GAP domain-containing protein n=1 Tax=Tritrichomonas foetus TaxID=1144522 RepID=A0A1J4JF28_9EUKA|nr:hypothetical protein TRFO_35950 [Tritrichomonas foetus]|eukprot:OHS97746.1 hypothetical protein TRFO_35950 [Tritrichomonas foetus]
MCDDLIKTSNFLKKAILSEDQNQTIIYLNNLIIMLKKEIEKDKNLMQSKKISNIKTTNIKASLIIIAKCVKNKIYERIYDSPELSDFPLMIQSILKNASLIASDEIYFKVLWEKTVKIATYLIGPMNISSWYVIIQRCFIATPTFVNVLNHTKILTQRFHFMLLYIKKRKLSTCQLWWKIISNSILCLYISYPVVKEKGKSLQTNCLNGPCPDQINDDLICFWKSTKIRSFFKLDKNSPTETIALIHFLVQLNDPPLFSIIDWFFSLWFPLCTQDFETTEPYELFSIFKYSSPQSIVCLMQLFSRYIVLQNEYYPIKNFFQMFDSLRFIWNYPISKLKIPEYLPKILFAIYAEIYIKIPPMAIMIFLVFAYDIQCCDRAIWEFFKTRFINGDDQFICVCKKFVSVLAINFAPLFFEFNFEETNMFFSKYNQRCLRNKKLTLPLNQILSIFSHPRVFEEYVANDSKMQKEFHNLVQENRVRFLDIELDMQPIGGVQWTVDSALLFVESIIGSFQTKMYVTFLSSLASVQEIIPIKILRHKDFIWNNFIKVILPHVCISKPNNNIFYTLSYAVSFMNTSTKDSKSDFLWIITIIRFLISKDTITRFTAFHPGMVTLRKFFPGSLLLIPFMVQQFTTRSPPKHDKNFLNFIISAYAFITTNIKLNISSTFYQISGQWKEIEIDTKLLHDSILLTNNKLDLTYKLLSIVPRSGKNKIIPLSFIAPIFYLELFNPYNNQIDPFIKDNIMLSLFQEKGPRNRMFSFYGDLDNVIIMKDFEEFNEFLAFDLARISIDHSFLQHSFENLPESFLNNFLQNLKDHLSNDIFYIITEIFPFIRYIKSPPTMLPETIQHYLILDNKALLAIENNENDGMTFYSRNFHSSMKYNIESFIHKTNPNNNAFYPYVKESESNKDFQKVEQVAFSRKMLKYFKKTKFDESNVPIMEDTKRKSYQNRRSLFYDEDITTVEQKNSTFMKYFLSFYSNPTILSFLNTFYDFNQLNSNFSQNIIIKGQSLVFHRKATPVFQCSCREQIKIGVLYVAENQFEQNEILSNTMDNVSNDFKEFILTLGQIVDLSEHQWYNGKLSNTDGKSIYYCNCQMEVIFHVAPMLPDRPDDPQRLYKKRHIGNDNVHIIWCENPAGYDTSVITSQFNDAHIVIFPTQNNYIGNEKCIDTVIYDSMCDYNKILYRVAVHKKNDAHSIYPLPSDSLVTKESLGFLVRTTAIIADRVVRDEKESQQYANFVDIIKNLTAD